MVPVLFSGAGEMPGCPTGDTGQSEAEEDSDHHRGPASPYRLPHIPHGQGKAPTLQFFSFLYLMRGQTGHDSKMSLFWISSVCINSQGPKV